MVTKAALWEQWLADTLVADIADGATADPVPLFEHTDDGGLTTSDALGSYKWGENDGEYLYMLYLLDGDGTDPREITPVYIGESADVSTRLGQHSRKIREALPVDAWADDGSWGSFSKYDHMAAVYEQTSGELYAWIHEIDETTRCPYGHETYRDELEAKLVGLVHSLDRYDRVFANREFVPNQILHEIGQAGPEWLTHETQGIEPTHSRDQDHALAAVSKTERWQDWVEAYLLADIQRADGPDPIPLFDTDESGQVRLTDTDRLSRSAAIDQQIRCEGHKCVDEDGLRDEGYDGLLYVMYQLSAPPEAATAADIVPRYIGKAEAAGKKRAMSANFDEIAYERDGTRSFARWGDGDFWHVGELSMALLGDDDRKANWAEALFEPDTRRLREPTYLWVRAWHSEQDVGPYDTPATLAEVEPLLIGLAHDAYPERLLNKEGVPTSKKS